MAQFFSFPLVSIRRMMGQKLLFPVLLSGVLMLGSCVSQGKYKRLDAKKTNYEMENKALKDRVETLEAKVKDLEKVNVKYTEAKEKELKDLGAKLEESNKAIQEMQAALKKQQEQQDQLVAQVKEKLSAYIPGDAAVEPVNGRISISLSEKLMFKANSMELNAQGKDVLKTISGIIAQQANMDVLVEAHTDDAVIKTASIRDNWDMSVMRAASVVRVMTGEYGVDPSKVLPAGKANYAPVADNNSAEGKQKNRRVEIILSPRTGDPRIVNSN